MKMTMKAYLIFLFLFSSLFGSTSFLYACEATDSVEYFFASEETLKTNAQWEDIIKLGEEALAICHQKGELETEFKILNTLVSVYFRLGLFSEAKLKAERLMVLGYLINKSEFVIESLYKISAALRGEAGSLNSHPVFQQLYFCEAQRLAKLALEGYEAYFCSNSFLKAKVLFNLGASFADNPHADVKAALPYFNEALQIFERLEKEDDRQRTLIRLGKVYLLLNEISEVRKIVNSLMTHSMENRTRLHYLFLEAQLLWMEGNHEEAINKAIEGRGLAIKLNAKADLERLQAFLTLHGG